MPSCPECGAAVVVAPLAHGSTPVALDSHEVSFGPDRFAVWDDGQARPVTDRADVLAHPRHRCRPPMPR